MGRPPIGKVAMTSAERVRRYRLKHVTKRVTKSDVEGSAVDLEQARRAYVALLPTDHEARCEELTALAQALVGLITFSEMRRFMGELDSIDTLPEPPPAPRTSKRKRPRSS